ncbi:hypothetical protein [Spirillospora sp. CA-294931]|uniref:hypothetical protein n=1 Tax=Spirillospora sp. CA-294931 TaxID=3240042 RepID=UPI003D9365B0
MSTLDGRRVYTRADLMEAHGLGRSTLEKWYREREANGHPEPAGTLDSQLAWDAAEWDAWFQARQAPEPRPGLASRDDLASRHGLSRHTLKKLWSERETNGHPEPAHRSGKAMYWNEAEWTAWYERHREPSDDPDALITLAEAGRLLGLAPSSVTVYATRPPKGWPAPAETHTLESGRLRRLYRRADILAYANRTT